MIRTIFGNFPLVVNQSFPKICMLFHHHKLYVVVFLNFHNLYFVFRSAHKHRDFFSNFFSKQDFLTCRFCGN